MPRVMAARVKSTINPALVTWARETAGFTAAEAAKRLKMDEERLAAWEDPASDQAPSIPQLRKLATLFKRPLAVFYLRETPPRFEVMRDLRRLPGTGARSYSPAVQLEIRAANERRELALELAADLEQELPKFTLSATDKEDPEKVGERIRTALGVTTELQLQWRDNDGRAGFNAWRNRIESLGVLIFQTTRFPSDEASGFAIAADTLPVIAVNRNDVLTRRAFSILHELAHLMIRVSGVSDIDTDAARPPEDQRVEVFCNRVAAAALIPRDVILAEARVVAQGVRSTNWSDAEISDLARQFNVSREAMLRRLLTFDRTTDEFYRQKRSQYIAEFVASQQRKKEKAATTEMKRNMPQETVSNFGKPLVNMLLDNYHQDRMTLSEVSGYLGLKVKHISKLEEAAGFRGHQWLR
jgi:Zn-dependent peptidase ImmA (M78 family)/transcriptional regulator with XRE-family HTH domain